MTFKSRNTMAYQEEQMRNEMFSWIAYQIDQTSNDVDTIRDMFDDQFPGYMTFFEDTITDLIYN